MREAAWVSESAQWTTTSWADHSPGFGRHCIASAGAVWSASRSRFGPLAYCSMRLARSVAVNAIAGPPFERRLRRRNPILGGKHRKGGEAPLRGLKRRGKVGLAHEVEVYPPSARPAFGNGPHDQGLPALHVAAGEDARRARHPGRVAPDVAPVG